MSQEEITLEKVDTGVALPKDRAETAPPSTQEFVCRVLIYIILSVVGAVMFAFGAMGLLMTGYPRGGGGGGVVIGAFIGGAILLCFNLFMFVVNFRKAFLSWGSQKA